MSRFFSRCLCVAALAAPVLVASALAQQPKAGPQPKPRFGPPGGSPGAWSPLYGLPGYSMLGSESVQKELELSDEQKQKLREIAEQYRRQVQEGWRPEDRDTFRKLPPEEQKKQLAAQRERNAKRMAEVAADTRAKIEAILLPRQVRRFEDIVFRARATVMLYNPRTLERLGVTDDQKERLRKVRDELQEKTQKLQQEAIDKTFRVLTPEQQAKLKEMMSEGFGFPGRPR